MADEHLRQTLDFRPFKSWTTFTRPGFEHDGHTSITFEKWTGDGICTVCPFSPCLRALRCFFTIFTPSTTTLSVPDKTLSTRPVFPRLFPLKILTKSFFLIMCVMFV